MSATIISLAEVREQRVRAASGPAEPEPAEKLRASPQLALYQAHDLDPATVAALDLLREVALKLGLTPKPGTAPHVSPR